MTKLIGTSFSFLVGVLITFLLFPGNMSEPCENLTALLESRDFPALKNDNILKAARGETPSRLPIWIMRQAGRYLPEFMEFRKKHTFFEICETPALACEVTLMPIKRFDLDAAIIFSDILVIPQGLGMEVVMEPKVGPVLPHPLTVEKISELKVEGCVDRLRYVGKAITLTRHKLEGKVPIFGFTGAPWTLMGYMIEGGGSKTLSKAKKWLYAHPEASHQVLNLLTDVIVDYLVMQAESGAQLLQVFDSSAEYLNKDLYQVYGIPYLRRINVEVKEKLQKLKLDVPMVLFSKGGSFSFKEQADLGYEILGVDWTLEPERARDLTKGKNITLQGNLDPCALYAPSHEITRLTKEMVGKFGTSRYIVNLGHGIYPDMDPNAVEVFINAVHSVSTS